VVADIGIKTFASVNSTLAALTGVPTSDPNVVATYQAVQQQLPPISTLESFSSAEQVGIAQIAIQYCNEMVNNPALVSAMFPGVTLSAGLFSTQGARQRSAQFAGGSVDDRIRRRARQFDKQSLQLHRLHDHRTGTGGNRRGLRDGLRQRRHVDLLSKTEEVLNL
jgi:hypothetical protein